MYLAIVSGLVGLFVVATGMLALAGLSAYVAWHIRRYPDREEYGLSWPSEYQRRVDQHATGGDIDNEGFFTSLEADRLRLITEEPDVESVDEAPVPSIRDNRRMIRHRRRTRTDE